MVQGQKPFLTLFYMRQGKYRSKFIFNKKSSFKLLFLLNINCLSLLFR